MQLKSYYKKIFSLVIPVFRIARVFITCRDHQARDIRYMHTPLPIVQNNQHLWLSPDRCIYWEEEKSLILSDLHFGKTGHFRKAGIAVPQNIYKEDLQRLVQMLQYFQPSNLLIVGDLFHSVANKELDLFIKWRTDFEYLSIQLIKGNHDILPDDWYREARLLTEKNYYSKGPFSFTHDITQEFEGESREDSYVFTGHMHPGIILQGTGKQSLRFSCFYFGKEYCVLPAFGRFTGTHLIEPQKNEQVFAIVNNSVVQLQ